MLESYLLSDTLFWNLSVSSQIGHNYPNLTIGGLLLFQKYAGSLIETEFQRNSYRKIETQFEAFRTNWRVAWGRKTTWEFQSRLRQWGHVLTEIRKDSDKNIPYYRYEVRTRVILSLLQPEISEINPAYLDQLENQDAQLRLLLNPGVFIWDAALVAAFPEDDYWFLWGLPIKH